MRMMSSTAGVSKFSFVINTSQRRLNKAWKIAKLVKSKY